MHINQTNHSWDVTKIVFDLEKNIQFLYENNSFQEKFSKI